ncbi:nicotinamide mononucleotide transporter [Microlunatus elymi]|uniref:Nicotinamide mononucleotide transporter n=1 Tax=Microlunatus elymi TaxID=2596828 RepID=A0A516Q1N2_9ACTN|nr:nicotinamide riboside transporter PnuC [Microlunatus elymi]QDP97336.1 nicotinamide mononucleotide transporter [Microlunatus elymi]
MNLSELLTQLVNAKINIGPGILWREIIGNGFGVASALLGMYRKVAAWPIGIVGNIILFTVFLGATFNTPQDLNLWGQAGRQVFFLIVSVYGWVKWYRFRHAHGGEGVAVQPRWASRWERLQLIIGAVVLWVIFYFALKALNSWGPASDAWILTGSILATYGMARGWTEFWLIWIAVDAVGVPLLFKAQLYPSAIMYIVYAAVVVAGFVSWWKIQRQQQPPSSQPPAGVEDRKSAGTTLSA